MVSHCRVVALCMLLIPGKTHLLYHWCLGEGADITTRPTESFNVEKVHCGGLILLVWDVGDKARRRQFFHGTEGLL